MWPKTFEARLASWVQLRSWCADQPLEPSLIAINHWWFAAPWCAYHLHWDDQPSWPDPWQLLEDNIFCDLARGLGMLYTIMLLDRTDMQSAALVQCESDNLVTLPGEKYILNWERDSIVNINLTVNTVHRSISTKQIQQQFQ